jgi:peptidoglycan/xylan/chitin deacetylase (PgdA/CDA1 family)
MHARRGPRRSDLAVAVACVLAVALFGAPPADPPGPAPAPAAAPRPQRVAVAAAVAPLDDDGVQRRVTAPEIALTFDDGPDPRWTPAVLALLRQYRVHATFCLVGAHVVRHPDLVRRIAEDGHALCDHTWGHDEQLPRRSPAAIRADLRRTSEAIERASGGRAPAYFRAPGGNWSAAVVTEARRLGLRPLGWSVDPRDWTRPPAATITRTVLGAARGGPIVLLHDGYGDRSVTVAALRTILAGLPDRPLVQP